MSAIFQVASPLRFTFVPHFLNWDQSQEGMSSALHQGSLYEGFSNREYINFPLIQLMLIAQVNSQRRYELLI